MKKKEKRNENEVPPIALCMDDIYIYGNDIEAKAIRNGNRSNSGSSSNKVHKHVNCYNTGMKWISMVSFFIVCFRVYCTYTPAQISLALRLQISNPCPEIYFDEMKPQQYTHGERERDSAHIMMESSKRKRY